MSAHFHKAQAPKNMAKQGNGAERIIRKPRLSRAVSGRADDRGDHLRYRASDGAGGQ